MTTGSGCCASESGQSGAFTLRPKAREVHCADFADRVLHHWLVPRLEAIYEPVFIEDSHSNRVGHGIHRAVDRLQRHQRRATANGKRPAWCLQLDIANFFNSIDRRRLYGLIRDRLGLLVRRGRMPAHEAHPLLWLTGRILAQDPAQCAAYRGNPARRERVPPHKRLSEAPAGMGLAIGNLPSQLFANIYLNELDQFVKHRLRARGYVRYVDDFVLIHPEHEVLVLWSGEIERFLAEHLGLGLRDAGRLAPAGHGVDFLGYIVRPGYRLVRNRVAEHFEEKLRRAERRLWRDGNRGAALNLPAAEAEALRATVESYLGHFRHAGAWRLVQRLMDRHRWLGTLFQLHDGPRLRPRWCPASVSGLRGQWRWFVYQWPGVVVLVQTGHRFEVYDDQARFLAEWLNVPLDDAPRRPFDATFSRPLRRLRGLRRYLRRWGVAHLFIAEEGHLPGGLKRRALRLAWWPRQPGLPLWSTTQGVRS